MLGLLRREGPPAGLWGLYLILALVYVVITPLYESPDEWTHVGMLHQVATTGDLPVQQVGETEFTPWAQEGSQPPLYYLAASLIYGRFDTSDFEVYRELNPHAIVGRPDLYGNQNHVLHDQLYPPPLTGAALAVYATRLFSVVLGAVTVFGVHATARTLLPNRPKVALLAAGITALNPQFLFIAGSVNNDNLVTALSSLVIWQTVVMLRDGFQTRRSLILVVLIALATLSKLSGLVMVLSVALAGLWVGWRRRDLRGLVTLGGLMVVCWGGIAGWWYLRNIQLYGELFGTQTMLDIFGRRPSPTLEEFLGPEFTSLRHSYWGLFGWFNITMTPIYYGVMDVLSALGVVGVFVALWRYPEDSVGARPASSVPFMADAKNGVPMESKDFGRRGAKPSAGGEGGAERRVRAKVQIVFLILVIAIGLASLIQWTAQTAASQGRLMFPYIAATSTLLALGLSTLRLPSWPAVVALGAVALVMPFAVIMPAYTPVVYESLPETAIPVYGRYGDDAVLVGYELSDTRYGPGDIVPLTLYWQPLRQSDRNYTVFAHLLDPNGNVIVKRNSYPGGGNLQTTVWEPGRIYADSYELPVPFDVRGHFQLRYHVGLWDYPDGQNLPVFDAAGEPLSSVIVAGPGYSNPGSGRETLSNMLDEPVLYGESIALLGYEVNEANTAITLLWEALAPVDNNYTVFVIVFEDAFEPGGENIILGQGDSPPPLPTHFWRAGDIFTSTHRLRYPEPPPAGPYPLYVGWYHPETFARLATNHPDNAYLVTEITVSGE